MGDWSCDGSSVRGSGSREEATDLARGESSRLLGRVGIEAKMKDQQEFDRWKKGGKGVQGMGNNRELATSGKLKITCAVGLWVGSRGVKVRQANTLIM